MARLAIYVALALIGLTLWAIIIQVVWWVFN